MASTSFIRILHGMFAGNYVYAVFLTLMLVNMSEICPYHKGMLQKVDSSFILSLLVPFHTFAGFPVPFSYKFFTHAQVLLLEDHGDINLMTKSVYDFCFLIVRGTFPETQGQMVGARESLNRWKIWHKRKVKNDE